MKALVEHSSNCPPSHNIGENVHMDITTSAGGNNYNLFFVDEKSDYIIGIPIQSKSTLHLILAVDVMNDIPYMTYILTISHFTDN